MSGEKWNSSKVRFYQPFSNITIILRTIIMGAQVFADHYQHSPFKGFRARKHGNVGKSLTKYFGCVECIFFSSSLSRLWNIQIIYSLSKVIVYECRLLSVNLLPLTFHAFSLKCVLSVILFHKYGSIILKRNYNKNFEKVNQRYLSFILFLFRINFIPLIRLYSILYFTIT